jgi:hypothetical protein
MQLQLVDVFNLDLLTIRFVDIADGRKREIERDNSKKRT